jgi:type IV secretion system protein VirB10
MQENNDQNLDEGFEAPEDAYTKQQSPAVASPPGKNIVVMGIFGIAVVIMLFMVFGGSGKKTDEEKVNESVQISKQPTITPPPIIIPPEPPEPPQPPVTPMIDENAAKELTEEEIQINKEQAERQKRRMQSDMLISRGGLFGGGLGGGNPAVPGQASSLTQINDNDPNIGFADSFFNQGDTPFAQARKLGDTSRLITQGKIIDAVLETPINTDVPGMIRAVVSRDIYAESGRMILIPKGSRLVGTYNSFIIRGNKRVNVIWSRVIRPDGIDVMIRSPGVNQLGVAGVEGEVDNKYMEIFTSAFLVSAINIAIAAGVDSIDNDQKTETQNTDGSTTTETNAKQEAALKALDMFGNAGTGIINSFLNLKPTITINQGARVNVFVNRDLVFPAGLTSSVKIIQ